MGEGLKFFTASSFLFLLFNDKNDNPDAHTLNFSFSYCFVSGIYFLSSPPSPLDFFGEGLGVGYILDPIG